MTNAGRVLVAAMMLLAGCALDEPAENPSPPDVLAAANALRGKIAPGVPMEEAKAQAEAQGMLCYWGANPTIEIAPKSLLLCSRSCEDSRRHGWWVTLAADRDGKLATIEETPMRSFAPRSCQTVVKMLSGNGARAAIQELASRFARESGQEVSIDFADHPELQRRIEEGERFDVTILDPPALDALIKAGKVAGETRAVIGRDLQTRIGFVAGVAKDAKEPEAAQALLRFFTAPAAAQVLRDAGVEPFVE